MIRSNGNNGVACRTCQLNGVGMHADPDIHVFFRQQNTVPWKQRKLIFFMKKTKKINYHNVFDTATFRNIKDI